MRRPFSISRWLKTWQKQKALLTPRLVSEDGGHLEVEIQMDYDFPSGNIVAALSIIDVEGSGKGALATQYCDPRIDRPRDVAKALRWQIEDWTDGNTFLMSRVPDLRVTTS